MNRPMVLNPGAECPDDVIPRCAPMGFPATRNGPLCFTPEQLFNMPAAYRSRVEDAMRMLRDGSPRTQVRARHGLVVLRDATAIMEARNG